MENNTIKADMGMLLTTVVWGFGFIATKVAAAQYTTIQILFYRFLISTVIMLAIFWKDLKGINKKEMIQCAALGFFLGMGFLLQTSAINYTTVSKNAFLTTLNVIFVPIIVASIHKKRIDAYSIAGCLLALIGTGIMSLEADFSINFGDILSILCAVFFSFHIYYLGVFAAETKTSVLAAGQIVFAGMLFLAASLVTREIILPRYETKAIASIIYLAVMCTCVSFLVQTYCQKFTSAVKAVVIFSFEAVFASIFAILIFGDAVTPRFLLGSGLIFIAVIISSTKLVFLRVLTKTRS